MPVKNTIASPAASPTPFFRPTSLRHQIAGALLRDIISGVYRPGQRLVERELVTRFGVSAIPIREALQDLENQGVLTKRLNAGCSVVELSPEDAEAVCAFRRALEPTVMKWAAARIDSANGEVLREKLETLRIAAEERDFPRFFLADLEFHQAIWEVAGNKWATRALNTAIGSVFASGLIVARSRGKLDLRAEVNKHERLLACLLKGDGERAASYLSGIAEGFENQLVKALKEDWK